MLRIHVTIDHVMPREKRCGALDMHADDFHYPSLYVYIPTWYLPYLVLFNLIPPKGSWSNSSCVKLYERVRKLKIQQILHLKVSCTRMCMWLGGKNARHPRFLPELRCVSSREPPVMANSALILSRPCFINTTCHLFISFETSSFCPPFIRALLS